MSSRSAYEYEIAITTGVWKNAGTTANVAIEIYGAEDSTGILHLNNETTSRVGPLFNRGASDSFLLNVEKSLGWIRGIRIGHDNSGLSPSWFLEDVVILDEQTQNSWTFFNSQWLALERGDGRIERILNFSTGNTDLNKEVLKRWRKDLTEKHIWVSVLTKPASARFSRVQRASCCLSILFTAMLANAMFYELGGKSSQIIQVGPLTFSWRQVIIGIQSALIVAPINILIAFMFQKHISSNPDRKTTASAISKWLVYIAWFLCFCTCAVSATFTIFYSLVWEKSKSEQWLSSMFISFIQDVTITEPAKIFLIAVFMAIIIRGRKKSDRSSTVEGSCQVSPKGRLWQMEISEVESMRKRQTKKLNVSRFFVDLCLYCTFVIVLMVVCYGNRSDHRYLMTKSIRNGLPRFREVFFSFYVMTIELM